MPIGEFRRESRFRLFYCLLLGVAVAGLVRPVSMPAEPVRRPPIVPSQGTSTVSVHTVYRAMAPCRKSNSEAERWRIAATVHQESLRYGYDPLFIAAMVDVESKCKPNALSTQGAVGLIQIQPATGRFVAAESGLPWRGAATLRDGVSNLRLGVRYLWMLEKQFDDPQIAVAAFNLGPGRVARMAPSRARSARYVRRVLARYHALVEQYGA
jgi:soluble lytic murein transglycosylase-like protein